MKYMVLKKDAILTILKSVDGTMSAAGLSVSSPKNPGENDLDIVFSGETGDVTLKINENIMEVLCKKTCDTEKSVAQILFDIESEEWNAKDSKSVANEIADSVASYFGTPLVLDTPESKSKGDKTKNKNASPEREEAIAKKKNKKESVVTYEPINLAYRMENIYPQTKGELDKNTEKYDTFLEEVYFETIATPLILDTIRSEDRQTLKKIFNAFNIFYEEGSKDVQGLIAVSILGINFAEEPVLFEKCSDYMDDDLRDAVQPIMTYLNSASGKKKAKLFHNPKPYKAKK